ncbi:MAG: hypothetical protein U0175_12950 [Caldilineaceae bacterium]
MSNHLQRIPGTRIVATSAALDAASWPAGALALRLAPDEIFVTDTVAPEMVSDPYAIVVADAGFAGTWLSNEQGLDFLAHHCEWRLPDQRPTFAQGMVAGLPMKLWFEQDRLLLLVPAPYSSDLEARLAE